MIVTKSSYECAITINTRTESVVTVYGRRRNSARYQKGSTGDAMDGALLTFDGVAQLAGRVEASENYFEFRTKAALSNTQLNELHRATIEIDGRIEGVLVESTDLLNLSSDNEGDQRSLRLTLRRNTATPTHQQIADH
ncbi:hypothetical protein [Paracoccus marcusii]|uniref:hypothetical protein n=1 Tax=Paracoccus marcusii TaxID=59779 RepID=UPI0032665AB4